MTNNKQQTEMNKEFIPYELALELKQLGFDEPCSGGYYSNQDNVNLWLFKEAKNSDRDERVREGFATAPTYSQAFRWFREKHNLIGGIEYIGGMKPTTTWWDIYVVGHYNTNPKEWEMKYQPYEEAEVACLRKLIEIVKTYGGGEQ
jgi:hypothetical protein